jgi:hypothetical protein
MKLCSRLLLAAQQLRTISGGDGHLILGFAPPSLGFALTRV